MKYQARIASALQPALYADTRHFPLDDESDPQSIARTFNQLLANREQAHLMRANAKRTYAEVFCYEKQFTPVLAWLDAQGIR